MEKIPKNPLLSCASFEKTQGEDLPSVLDVGAAQYVNRGSLALALVFRHMELMAGEEVLLPAYHCIAMVEPLLWAGGTPVFYKIREDLSPDLQDVESRITPATRALVVPHYFGFHQDTAVIRRFCDSHGLLMIEDCAHAFFGRIHGHPIGFFGDYAIGSAWKFFPVSEGACVVSSRHDLSGLVLQEGGWFFEAKSLFNTLEYALEYDRLGRLNTLVRGMMGLKNRVWNMRATHPPSGGTSGQSATETPGGFTGFEGRRVFQKNSRWSQWVMSRTSVPRLVGHRRANYLRLSERLGKVAGCRPLFSQLPEGVAPQVFPLVMEEPEVVFPKLKQAGVPVIRFGEYLWGGMTRGLCAVSENYSRRVFQLPCHQDLTQVELDWMSDQMLQALPGGGA